MEELWIFNLISFFKAVINGLIERFTNPVFLNFLTVAILIYLIFNGKELIKIFTEDNEAQEEKIKKPLNSVQKTSIVLMIIGFATWLVHYGWSPERAAVGFILFFGSLTCFFIFRDK